MKLLENTLVQTDSDILADNEQVKIEQLKLTDDLSTTTITVHGMQEYTFTSRSGIAQTYVGTGTIVSGSETFDLNLFNKIALIRGERVTILNNQTIPLVINIISAN